MEYSSTNFFSKINSKELLANLDNKEIGTNIIVYERLQSTNSKGKELALNGCRSGTVIIAEEQTAGRGRQGRSWHSPKGTGLWLSIIVYPKILPLKAPFLTILASLAVYETINYVEKEIKKNTWIDDSKLKNNKPNLKNSNLEIKWPNDLLLDGKKISGILSEISISKQIKYAVVGIGINVNQENFPKEIGNLATSLKIKYKQDIDRIKILKKLLSSFEKYYYLLLNDKCFDLLNMYKEKLNIINKEVEIYSGEKIYQGRVIDISDKGELIVNEIEEGIKRFWAGDVSLRRK